jgi:PPOX class probable F420-dependent enzyme
MTWVEKLANVENRFLDWARTPKAARVAEDAPTGRLQDLRGRRYCVIVTYRKSGEGVPSPVWFGVDDGKLYFHTGETFAKTKRIRHNPEVRVAPCSFRGRPLGPPFVGQARVVSSSEEADAERCIQANYGWIRRLYYRMSGQESVGVYIEVTPER